MVIFRLLIIVFNVLVVTFLVYRLLQIFRQPMDKTKKAVLVITGLLLLLVPFGIFFRIFVPSFQYFFVYPVAISLFLYLVKEV
ncbi:MAG: hypothetical protein L0Y35_08175 [Flammeovirgaceae bacterium]|nr:hypothetical protein [Flammeovirgaceae bacterium]